MGGCGRRPALTGARGTREGAAQRPAAGAGSAPRTGRDTGPRGLFQGREEEAGREAASFFAPPDIPTSSVGCAPDAAYSAAGFEVWATARLGPGDQGGRRGGRLRQEPARQPHALCPDSRAV